MAGVGGYPTHAYNCTVSLVTGFSPYFLMFGWTPKIPLDIEMGVTLIDHKRYYDQKMRCTGLKPNDLVLVHAKAPSGNHKIADQWEDAQHRVLSQLNDQQAF